MVSHAEDAQQGSKRPSRAAAGSPQLVDGGVRAAMTAHAATVVQAADGHAARGASAARSAATAVHGSQLHWHDIDKVKFFAFMPMGAVAIRAAVYPLSLVKTRMQADVPRGVQPYRGVTDAVRTIVRHEGPRALYKGFGVSLLNVAVGPVYLPVFEATRTAVATGLSDRPALAATLAPGAAGLAASCVAQLMVVPIDVVSQLQMTARTSAGAPSPLAVARHLVATQGAASLWRGYFVSLATYAPGCVAAQAGLQCTPRHAHAHPPQPVDSRPPSLRSAIMWSSFAAINSAITGALPQRWFTPQSQAASPLDGIGPSIAVAATSGALAGAVSGCVTNPIDVVRARLQLDGASGATTRETVRELLRQHGYRGFARGLWPRVLSMAQGTAMVQAAYETLKRASALRPE